MTPAECIKESVQTGRCVAVTFKSGVPIFVSPCLISPAQILGNSLNNYQSLILELRNAWAKSELTHGELSVAPEIWGQVALLAILENYEVSRATISDWLSADGEEVALVEIAAIACGYVKGNKAMADQRRRALGVACIGLADVPMTANEIAQAFDFASNTKQSAV